MSIVQITGHTGPKLFRESLYKMRTFAEEEKSRNGTVDTIFSPVLLRLLEPRNRVITDPIRDANPFFHVMEFIWMMAGSNNIQWIAQFNKNMMKFSDDGVTQHAAYGYRWRKNWGLDQVKKIINLIRKNPLDRRLVINMWDPGIDLGHTGVDVPCNTQLLFRVVEDELQMTVINRSNDLIWGALGANLCHMTMLQELIAQACGLNIGTYYVFTQNLHIYHDVPNYTYYMGGVIDDRDIYSLEVLNQVPLLQDGEIYSDFVADCNDLVNISSESQIRTHWMRHVGSEMYKIWLARKVGKPYNTQAILADDWRIACEEWINRRSTAVGNQQRDYYAGHARREQESKGLDPGTFQPNPMAAVDNPVSDVGPAPTESGTDGTVHQEPF